MRKKIILGIIILLSVSVCLAIVKPDMFSKGESAEHFLKKAGFTNTNGAIYGESETFWHKKYGLHFFSFPQMDVLCKENGFLVGPSTSYIGSIPDSSANTMMKNYKAIKGELKRYELRWGNSADVVARFNINELKGKARRHLPAFNSHDWGWMRDGDDNRKLSKFVYSSALEKRGLPPSHEDFSIVKNYEYEKIYIIAHHSKFDSTNMKIGPDLAAIPVHKNPDPLAVVKTERGWVILAAWQ